MEDTEQRGPGIKNGSEWSNLEKRFASNGGLLFSKLFRLDLINPFSFRPKVLEILVEWIMPNTTLIIIK